MPEERALVRMTKQELTKPMGEFKTARRILRELEGELLKAASGRIDPVYLARVALTTVQRTPRLLDCTGSSFISAMLESAQLALAVDGVLGQGFLVPYNGVCQFQIGYRGLIALARRSEVVEHVTAECVREGDDFAYELGTESFLRHHPKDDAPPDRPITHVYAIAPLVGATRPAFKVWTRDRIEAHAQKYSQAYKKKKRDCPWITTWHAMAMKTVVRDLCKYLADSPELCRAACHDEYKEAGVFDKPKFDITKPGMHQFGKQKRIDAEDVTPPPATGEGREGVPVASGRSITSPSQHAASGAEAGQQGVPEPESHAEPEDPTVGTPASRADAPGAAPSRDDALFALKTVREKMGLSKKQLEERARTGLGYGMPISKMSAETILELADQLEASWVQPEEEPF